MHGEIRVETQRVGLWRGHVVWGTRVSARARTAVRSVMTPSVRTVGKGGSLHPGPVNHACPRKWLKTRGSPILRLRAHELTPTPEMDVSGVVSRRIRARSQPKHKTFFYKNFLKKNFLKSLTNFNLTPFGPQNRRILCLCQTEILGQLLNFTKEVQKHRTRNVKNLRLRRIHGREAPLL